MVLEVHFSHAAGLSCSEANEKFQLLVHGGAWDIPAELSERHVAGVTRALNTAKEMLVKSDTLTGDALTKCAIDAIAEALAVMEDDDVFDAGYGSFLNEHGTVEMDASVMEGEQMQAGAVALVSCFPHPGKLAAAVLHSSPHVLLAGPGAEAFGDAQGFQRVEPLSLVLPREIENHKAWVASGKPDAAKFFAKSDWVGKDGPKRGTVGVVIGVKENEQWKLFSGTSTGGTPGKHAGRIGDVPIVGSGIYADNESAAVSCTGYGEALMRVCAAKNVSDLCRRGVHPQQAVEETLEFMFRKTQGRGGIIAIDHQGRCGAAFSTPDMAFASTTSDCSHLPLGHP